MSTIYDYKDYRDYVKNELDSARFGRGGRSELARKLGMELSLLSRILAGKSDFTPEHGFKAALFFDLEETAQKYFMLLLNRSRAGSVDLKKHYQGQIDKIKDAQNKIKSKISTKSELSEVDLLTYFGSWHHMVVQMAVRNEKLRTVEAIAKYLRVPPENARLSLSVLKKIGLVRETKSGWEATEARVHFSKYPSALRVNHTNLRNMAIRSFDEQTPQDLHYSLVLSADSEAVRKIREMLLGLVKNTEPVIAEAKDEQVLALCLDFFKVGGID